MFQPISFNVIAQALDWHGMPRPTLRQLSYYDCFADHVSAEYLARWTRAQVEAVVKGFPSGDGSYYCVCFANRLRECFCEDVKLVQLHADQLKEELSALLYVEVPFTVLVMAESLTETRG